MGMVKDDPGRNLSNLSGCLVDRHIVMDGRHTGDRFYWPRDSGHGPESINVGMGQDPKLGLQYPVYVPASLAVLVTAAIYWPDLRALWIRHQMPPASENTKAQSVKIFRSRWTIDTVSSR